MRWSIDQRHVRRHLDPIWWSVDLMRCPWTSIDPSILKVDLWWSRDPWIEARSKSASLFFWLQVYKSKSEIIRWFDDIDLELTTLPARACTSGNEPIPGSVSVQSTRHPFLGFEPHRKISDTVSLSSNWIWFSIELVYMNIGKKEPTLFSNAAIHRNVGCDCL